MTIREVITEKIAKHTGQTEPFDLALFVINMAGIIDAACVDLASANMGQIFCGNEKVGKEARDCSSVADIISIINGEDMMRNMVLTMQTIDFFKYFLDQNEPDEDDEDVDGSPLSWCDLSFILQKWNERAAEAHRK